MVAKVYASPPPPLHFFIEELERRWREGEEEVMRRWSSTPWAFLRVSCVGAFEHQHTSKSKGNLAFFVVPWRAFSASGPRALIERAQSRCIPRPRGTRRCCFGDVCLCCRGALFYHSHHLPLPPPHHYLLFWRYVSLLWWCFLLLPPDKTTGTRVFRWF